ncbi:AAA family ATPase [Tritonibacter scottomollicae]|uniref:AAA domain-containing protein n=1 Tax=Tritonibacter scottomollicae TaxID=483013 RepID=A0A2T1AI91_TRISK|nr:ATP-binding protein [Tritonibacter scottomollicae]PRZ48324.1 AAA domain-containing protein [Tritonibacter scottomollicae]
MTPNIAPLRNVAALTALVDRVHDRSMGLPGMAVFYGPSGWGKTTATTFVTNEYGAYCVQVLSCWTPSYFLQSIMKEIGLKPVRGVPAMVDAIAANLARVDRPLIIDDAQYLTKNKKLIELARDLYEASQTTLILVGEEELPQHLTKWENIHNRQLAHEPALACNLSDATKLAQIYSPTVEITEDLLGAIVEASGGSIRRVVTNIDRAKETALSRGTNHADLALWGTRDFETGQPPAVRRVAATPAQASRPALKAIGGQK